MPMSVVRGSGWIGRRRERRGTGRGTHGFRPSGLRGFLRGLMASALESFGGAGEEEGATTAAIWEGLGRMWGSWEGRGGPEGRWRW